MSFIPKPHEIYKHFKGNLYQIVTIAEHSETGEQLVIYQALYGDYKTYARPLAMFTDRVDKQKYPDIEQEFRFELQGADSARQKAESTPENVQQIQEDKQGKVEVRSPLQSKTEEEAQLDPMVLQFLEADSYEERLNILAGLHHRITDDMIITMAIACDVDLPEGDVEERFLSLKNCLLTLEKYECNRLR